MQGPSPSIIILLTALAAPSAFGQAGTLSGAAANSTAITRVDDSAAGWMWSGMSAINDRQAGHAGGPGSHGVYTFSGTSVQVFGLVGSTVTVDGVAHKLGKLAVSIDGHRKAEAKLSSDEPGVSVSVFKANGLAPGNHVLEVRAEDGWAEIDGLLLSSSTDAEATVDDSSGSPGRVLLHDTLDDLSHVSDRSPNWGLDTSNQTFFNGKATRAVRSQDSKAFLEYKASDVSAFRIRIYTKSPNVLLKTVQIFTSIKGVYDQTPTRLTSVLTADGGSGGGWTVIDLAPDRPLPAGVDAVAIVVNPQTGVAWDPQIAEVMLTSSKSPQ